MSKKVPKNKYVVEEELKSELKFRKFIFNLCFIHF